MASAQQEPNIRRAIGAVALVVLFMASLAVGIRTARSEEATVVHGFIVCSEKGCSGPILTEPLMTKDACIDTMDARRAAFIVDAKKTLTAGLYQVSHACVDVKAMELVAPEVVETFKTISASN